jgi:hypothetical protein
MRRTKHLHLLVVRSEALEKTIAEQEAREVSHMLAGDSIRVTGTDGGVVLYDGILDFRRILGL